jgi:hypothetical protein
MDTRITDPAEEATIPARGGCSTGVMSDSLSPCAAAKHAAMNAEQLVIPLNAITLSSQRQVTDTTYGVQCMLHVEDTLSTVTVSSVVSKVEAIDDVTLEVSILMLLKVFMNLGCFMHVWRISPSIVCVKSCF